MKNYATPFLHPRFELALIPDNRTLTFSIWCSKDGDAKMEMVGIMDWDRKIQTSWVTGPKPVALSLVCGFLVKFCSTVKLLLWRNLLSKRTSHTDCPTNWFRWFFDRLEHSSRDHKVGLNTYQKHYGLEIEHDNTAEKQFRCLGIFRVATRKFWVTISSYFFWVTEPAVVLSRSRCEAGCCQIQHTCSWCSQERHTSWRSSCKMKTLANGCKFKPWHTDRGAVEDKLLVVQSRTHLCSEDTWNKVQPNTPNVVQSRAMNTLCKLKIE